MQLKREILIYSKILENLILSYYSRTIISKLFFEIESFGQVLHSYNTVVNQLIVHYFFNTSKNVSK
jgi:hypothetical protein